MADNNNIEFAPNSPWVDVIATYQNNNIESQNGVRILLSDTQLKWHKGDVQRYYRQIESPISQQGLGLCGHLSINFNPHFQKLLIHKVNIIRDGNIVYEADASQFEILRREKDIERRIIDGSLSANLLVPGLRVNDVLDYSYSILGESEVTAGNYYGYNQFAWGFPCAHQRFRIVVDKNIELAHSVMNDAPEMQKSEVGNDAIYTWEKFNTKIAEYETAMPSGYNLNPVVEVGVKLTWQQIADIFAKYYISQETLPKEIADFVSQLKSKHQDPKALCCEALRFAQREIRYFAISIGDGGFVPRKIADIWNSRYGDCKDKSLLLVRILKECGIEAYPALVHTDLRGSINNYFPCVGSFNHCIVKVKIGEQFRYLEPTNFEQFGNWDTITPIYYEYALPLGDKVGLEKIEVKFDNFITERYENWVLTRGKKSGGTLQLRRIYRAYFADAVRNNIADDGFDKWAQNCDNFYTENYHGGTQIEKPIVNDNKEANEIEIISHISLPEAFVKNKALNNEFFFWHQEEQFPDFQYPNLDNRKSPLYLGVARKRKREIIMKFPKPHKASNSKDTIKGNGWEVFVQWKTKGSKALEIKQSFTCGELTVPAKDVRPFADQVAKCDNSCGFKYNLPFYHNWFAELMSGPMGTIITILAIFAASFAYATFGPQKETKSIETQKFDRETPKAEKPHSKKSHSKND